MTQSEKLTATQVKALIDLRDDTRHGFRNAGLGNRTGKALRRKGLVEWTPGRWYGGKYRITDAGRLAIKAGDAE